MLKDRLKDLREERNLTKAQVAEEVGVTVRAYIAYEYGERDLSTDVLCRFADFYGVSADYLLGRTEEVPDGIELLVKEFHLSKMEELLVRAYFMSEPEVRQNFINFAEKIVQERENFIESQKAETNNPPQGAEMPAIAT